MIADLGRHAGFILASYGVAILLLGGLILHSVLGFRAARARLERAERRSDPR